MSYTGTGASSALGTQYAIKVADTFTIISEIKTATQSGATNKTADATNLESTAEEFVCVIPASGKFELECNRLPADPGQVAVKASFDNATTCNYQVTTPDAYVYTFKAIVEEFEVLPKIGPNDLMTVKIGIKVSGAITETAPH